MLARNKHYENCSIIVKSPSDKEEWLKLHDGQYQVNDPFILQTHSGRIFNPFEQQYIEKSNRMKAEHKGKTPYVEKVNTYVPSGWCVYSTFTYGDVFDPLKMHRVKSCVEKLVEHI